MYILEISCLSVASFAIIFSQSKTLVCYEAEVDVFLEFSWFFYDLVDIGNLISDSSAFSKSCLNTWKFMVHELFEAWPEEF